MGQTVRGLFTKQQMRFIISYCSPGSDTFQNAYRSAIKAGYTESYAKSITTRDQQWLQDLLTEVVGKPTDKKNLIEASKKVLSEALEKGDMSQKLKAATFTLSTDTDFSKKQDVTSKGEPISAPVSLVEFVDGKQS